MYVLAKLATPLLALLLLPIAGGLAAMNVPGSDPIVGDLAIAFGAVVAALALTYLGSALAPIVALASAGMRRAEVDRARPAHLGRDDWGGAPAVLRAPAPVVAAVELDRGCDDATGSHGADGLRAQDLVLATLGHEISTLAASAAQATRRLRCTPLTSQQATYLDTVRRTTGRLCDLASDLAAVTASGATASGGDEAPAHDLELPEGLEAAIDALADEACAQGVPVTTGAYRSMRIVVLHSLGGVPVRARPALAVAR